MITTWLTAAFLALSACAAPAAPVAHAAAPIPPYSRDAFGDGWRPVNRWCDQRDVILARDLTATTTSHGCNVLAGTLHDPYTGRVVVGSTRALDVDHRYPLERAWEDGAWQWSLQQRERFANDPDNLVVTIASVNRSKGSDGPSSWMPVINRCLYGELLNRTAARYDLHMRVADLEAVRRACRT